MNQQPRPSGAVVTGVVAKLAPDANDQARIMRGFGPSVAAPICAEFAGGYLMPQLEPLVTASSVPAVLRAMWGDDGFEDPRLVSREEYAAYVAERLNVVPSALRPALAARWAAAVQPDVDYPASVHGDATLANFMQLGGRTVAIDVSPRPHYGSPTQDISKLLLSFYGGLHCPVPAETVAARENFEREATASIRDLPMDYDWLWNSATKRLSVSENLLWDLFANAIRVLSREDNPKLYNFVTQSVGVL